ncbi:MAG: amidohydrolase [Candidatus Heimdallarchaeota archaeon]
MIPKSFDQVHYNAHIITMDSENESAEMIGITQNKFTYVGPNKTNYIDRAEKVRDLGGKTIIPGMIDLHTHLWKEAEVISVDLGQEQTYSGTIDRLAQEVRAAQPGEWIFASKWDESRWPDRKEFLSRQDLDEISPNNPVYTYREDGHLVVCNSLALKQLSIPPDHAGVERDISGNPTGVLKDVWLDLIPYYKDKLPHSIEKSVHIAASKGITAVVDNLTIRPSGQQYIIQTYLQLDLLGKIPIRIFLNPTRELIREFTRLGIPQNWGSHMVRFSGFKGFFDGALGAQTALLKSPYIGIDHLGDKFLEEEELIEQIVHAEKHEFTLCVHAIGDQAIELLLECYEKGITAAGYNHSNRRHRIEHAEMVSDEHIRRAKTLGILLSMQPNFLKWEYPGELYEQRLGKERYMTLNRFAAILRHGHMLNFGSDNMPLSPFYGIRQATSFPSPEVKISVLEALNAYTIANAKALFMEDQLGSITVGKRADFVTLSQDPTNIDSKRLTDDLVVTTVVGGKEIYQGDS